MLIQRAQVYRLEPSEAQASAFAQRAGVCRTVYNLALDQRRTWGQQHRLSYNQQQGEITDLRADVDWIKAVPVHALQMTIRALDNAFQRLFTGLGEFPTPRKKFVNDSFTLPDPSYLGFKRLNKNRGAVRVPKVGWVKLVGYRPLGGELRSITISRKAGNWFVSVAWQKEVADPVPAKQPSAGLDRGIMIFAALSDGTKIKPISAFKAIRTKLAHKTRFGANWKKQKAKITRLHRKAANARKDYLHKLSSEIAKNHGVIKIERLRVKNMSKSTKGTVEIPGVNVKAKSGLNRLILDQGWSMFATMLRYKLAQRGGQLVEVDPRYTSQACAECGAIDRANRPDQATFACVACGHTDNADVNAARNIHQSRALAVEPPKRTLRRVGKRKQIRETIHISA
jgi:putative transposase